MADWWKNEFYSQFGEDSILFSYFRSKGFARSRRLDDLGTGFYVDIGSHHPFMISNTYFFYLKGWSGITVDPTPGVKEEFDRIRPRDTNVQMAIARNDGTATFYSYGRVVHNTLDASRIKEGNKPQELTVETLRLSTLLDRYMPPGTDLSILSVDVEGVDLEVLQSNDWTRYRPELVVAEHHESSIARLVSSEIFSFMVQQRYELFGWTQPSLVFRRR